MYDHLLPKGAFENPLGIPDSQLLFDFRAVVASGLNALAVDGEG